MSISGKRPAPGALLSVLILLVLLCYLAVFGIINFPGFTTFCTTDMYEDTLVARLMWEQKTLFPDNFLFGNQFYVIATPVLSALFYGLTGSMNFSMGLATTVMSLLILLSLNWMLRPFVKERLIRYAALLALVASVYGPRSVVREDGQLFFVMCSFYACYLISFFCIMGDYVRARESEELRPGAFALALFLSFCTGMQSLRQTCVSMLPILCFEALWLLVRWVKTKKLSLSHRSAQRAFAYLAANGAGVLFIGLLDVKRNEIYYGQSIFSGASISEKIKDMNEALVTVSGFDFTRGDQSLFFTVMFIYFSLVIVAALFQLLRRRDIFSPTACFWWLCLISIAAVIAASFVTSVSLRPIYLFPCYTLPALSIAVVGAKLSPRLRCLLCLSLCTLAATNIYFSYHKDISLSFDKSVSDYEQVSTFAVENGFEYVYGSHSHTAPKIAAQSDGKLIAGCWEDEVIFKISPHINIKNIYHLSDYSKALFVFQEEELKLFFKEAHDSGTGYTFLGQFGRYYLYTTSGQMMYPISENINAAWLFPEYN